jgi:hypothetical protein
MNHIKRYVNFRYSPIKFYWIIGTSHWNSD